MMMKVLVDAVNSSLLVDGIDAGENNKVLFWNHQPCGQLGGECMRTSVVYYLDITMSSFVGRSSLLALMHVGQPLIDQNVESRLFTLGARSRKGLVGSGPLATGPPRSCLIG